MDETSERVFFVDEEGKSTVNFSTKGEQIGLVKDQRSSSDDISNPGVYVSLSSDSDLATVSFSFKSHSPNSSFSILLTVKDGNQLVSWEQGIQ